MVLKGINYCYYCGNWYQRFSSHLEQSHKDREVKLLKTLKGKEKYEKFHELKGMGDFQHNTKVLWSGGVWHSEKVHNRYGC